MSPPAEAAALSRQIKPPTRSSRIAELAFKGALIACLLISLIVLAGLIIQVTSKGIGHISLSFFQDFPSTFPDNAGIRPALIGTLLLMVVCAAFIVPVGVATAVYLEEFANRDKWWNRLIEVNIQNLAAVPSIIYGILGLAFLVRGPFGMGRILIAGGLTLGLLVLPVVIIAGREAIRAVPPSIREGSMALGATQWQTIWKQVLPAAIPGIATGVILALSRAIGETAPLIVVGAAVFVSFDPELTSQFTALPIQIFNWISQPQTEFKVLAAAAIIVLLAMLLAMNALAIWLRNKYEKKW
ncbi:MAG: phosphate ABC transporter permease PstA [Solirubrobacterales bacterium]